MKRTVFALVIFFFTGIASLPLSAEDSGNIQSFNDMVTVRAFMGFMVPSVDIMNDYLDTSKKVSYQPNPGAGGYYGVGIGWNGIGFSLVGGISSSENEEEKYGKSSFENYTMFFYGRQYGVDLFYQRYKGCYMSNPEDFGLHEGDPETIRPDLSLSTLGFNAYYVFSGDFSLIAAFSQTERQLDSGGSFLFMVSVMRIVIDSDGPLFPAAYDGGGYAGFRGGRFYSIAVSPGYAYTFVYGGLYLTLGAFLGGGLVYQELDVDSGEKRDGNLMFRSSVKSALGYNGERFFAGIMVIYDIVSSGWWSELDVDHLLFNYELFAGTRF
jgi:hypothetical protein